MTPTLEPPEIGTREHTALVAMQNDQFRRWHTIGERKPGIYVPGRSVWTAAFDEAGGEFQRSALKAIGGIETFEPDSDPDGFHDFGAVEIDGRSVWFKIDAYDTAYRFGSENPANLSITCRVLTILFPSDW